MPEKAKILIIDDEEVVRDSCTRMLRGGDYDVATAPDGTAGLELARGFQPDLVFVDLKMPGISGFEVLERLDKMDPAIVKVVITGYATVGSAVDAMKKGAYDFLPKPATPEEFRLITNRALERRRLVLETQALRRERELLREQFAAIVSHELKSPLGALQQNLFLLVDELADKLNDGQRQHLERMKVRVADLLKLIQTWLRLMTTDIGKIRDSFQPVAVGAVVAKAVEAVQPQAVRKNIEILVNGLSAPSPVQGDEGTLVEALVNVLNNAVKYSPGGTKVRVTTAEAEGQVAIAVTDSGIGIAAEDLPRVFQDFYRAASASGEQGCGLGLPLSRRIMEAHDGSISVTSEPGKGSTFVIRLPALAGSEKTGETT